MAMKVNVYNPTKTCLFLEDQMKLIGGGEHAVVENDKQVRQMAASRDLMVLGKADEDEDDSKPATPSTKVPAPKPGDTGTNSR